MIFYLNHAFYYSDNPVVIVMIIHPRIICTAKKLSNNSINLNLNPMRAYFLPYYTNAFNIIWGITCKSQELFFGNSAI